MRHATLTLLTLLTMTAIGRAQPPTTAPANHPPVEKSAEDAPGWLSGYLLCDSVAGPAWHSARGNLASAGIDLRGSYTLDSVKNFRGGRSTNNWEFVQQFDLQLKLDLAKMNLIPGGRGLDNALVGIVRLAVQF